MKSVNPLGQVRCWKENHNSPRITPSRTGSPRGEAVTDVILPYRSARSVSVNHGKYFFRLPGIVFDQIAPACLKGALCQTHMLNTTFLDCTMRPTACIAYSTSDFCEKQDEGGDDRYVSVRYCGLSADLRRDRCKPAAETLQDLRKHKFDIRSVGTSGTDHHCDAAVCGYQYHAPERYHGEQTRNVGRDRTPRHTRGV